MTQDEARKLPLGLYRLYWDGDGGESSLAAVGQCYDGSRWFAPINWTCEPPQQPEAGAWPLAYVATTDWSDVWRVTRIETE